MIPLASYNTNSVCSGMTKLMNEWMNEWYFIRMTLSQVLIIFALGVNSIQTIQLVEWNIKVNYSVRGGTCNISIEKIATKMKTRKHDVNRYD